MTTTTAPYPTGSTAAWQRTARQLRVLIKGYERGTRLPSVVELAEQLDAGQTNTYRAVRQLAQEGLLKSAPRRGTFVTGVGSRPRRQLAPLKPVANTPRLAGKHVALMHAEHVSPDAFVLNILDICEAALVGDGARTSHHVFPAHVNARPRFDQYDADAIVVINPETTPPIACRDNQVMAIISTASDLNVTMAGRYDVVSVQQEQSSLLASHHLRACGAEQACFLGVHPKNQPGQLDLISRRRLTGFERGWGRSLPEKHVLECWAYNVEPGAAVVTDYLQLNPRPKAVFAATDELAVGFALGATAHGLRAGHDYFLVGFDGQEIARNLESGPITTLAIPRRQMARCAADYLAERILNPDQPVRLTELGCHLRQGASTPAVSSTTTGDQP